MPKLIRPAAKVKQGDLTLYATSLRVRDLMIPDFYNVEQLDPNESSDRGYQRLLNKARAKKLADYIVQGQESQDAFLPTSIFIATHKEIPFDESSNTITIDIYEIGPFNIVDGQHRVEGLRMAAEKDPRVFDFEIPVNIAVALPRIAQMCHFLIVNTTQKSVEKSVEQRIMSRLTQALDLEILPLLPRWISRTVKRGDDDLALKYVDFLNSDAESPWFDRIRMANQDRRDTTVNQQSFVKSVKKFLLVASNPLLAYPAERQHKVFSNYWKALANVLGDEDTVLYKYNGVDTFCRFAVPFFTKLAVNGNWTVPIMEELLTQTFENVDGEYAGIGHPDFWRSGGVASGLNTGGLNKTVQELMYALNRGGSSDFVA
ncbi:DGQHR domain-containing protein [bacterium]|nr:DGQHR domain-containing protein [bacterium]